MKRIELLLQKIWLDYIDLNPSVKKIYDLFAQNNEVVFNDHIAFRTFAGPQSGIAQFENVFVRHGYVAKGEYHFVEKKLFAKHYEHANLDYPKIFISELKWSEFSENLQDHVKNILQAIPIELSESEEFCLSGRQWDIQYSVYNSLKAESEYAAWLYAFGFRPNHFTVDVNRLKAFPSLQSVNEYIKSKGFVLNSSGGEIKGSPQDYLEQSSTMANPIPVEFSEGVFEIPSCYYEFAKRYRDKTGNIYQGFIEKSADKIFESTDNR